MITYRVSQGRGDEGIDGRYVISQHHDDGAVSRLHTTADEWEAHFVRLILEQAHNAGRREAVREMRDANEVVYSAESKWAAEDILAREG